MKKIKPLIISRTLPYLGGREIMVDKLINSFSGLGKVSVLTPDRYPKKKNVSICSTDKEFEDILKWAKKQRVDVVNCHTFYLADLAIFLSKELKKPLVFTLHGVFINYYGEKYKGLLNKIYKHSDKVITVSDDYGKNLAKCVGNSSKITTVKNGINLDQIDSLNKTIEFYRRKNNIPLNKFVVVVPARLNYLKGLEYLVSALNKIKTDDLSVIICSPKGRKNKDEVVYKNKLKNIYKNKSSLLKFKYLDNGEIFEYYKSADIVLLPSLIEGISIALLEAMAFSKTVVATKVGGNLELIDSGKDGYLIKSKNSTEIKKILNKLMKFNDPKIGKLARKKVEKRFSLNIMFNNYYKILKQAIHDNK